MTPRRALVPAAEVDAYLRALPPIDVDAWNRDIAEIDALLHDTELGPPQEDEPRTEHLLTPRE